MLIKRNASLKDALKGQTVLLTGGGGGIGLEAARAFAWLGARVILAEIDADRGQRAQDAVDELSPGAAEFYAVDLGDEAAVRRMADDVLARCGFVDVLFHNATVTPMGAVDDVDIAQWDHSYQVNLRAPLLLTQRLLPGMKARRQGTLIFVSSSGASPYMGAYEVFKTSQVELSNTLAMELEGTGVHAYTIGPGLVKTATAMAAIEIVAARMGMGIEEFYRMNSTHILDAESAGVGFALSVLKAQEYHGQEISSIQVLKDFDLADEDVASDTVVDVLLAPDALESVRRTYEQQYEGWRVMNVFERQWVFRDFKKYMGQSAEQALEALRAMDARVRSGDCPRSALDTAFLAKLRDYWKHQLQLLKGYQKNKTLLEEQARTIEGWIADLDALLP